MMLSDHCTTAANMVHSLAPTYHGSLNIIHTLTHTPTHNHTWQPLHRLAARVQSPHTRWPIKNLSQRKRGVCEEGVVRSMGPLTGDPPTPRLLRWYISYLPKAAVAGAMQHGPYSLLTGPQVLFSNQVGGHRHIRRQAHTLLHTSEISYL